MSVKPGNHSGNTNQIGGEMPYAGIVLAAGYGSIKEGSSKLTEGIGKRSLVRSVTENVVGAGCSPVVVVINPVYGWQVQQALKDMDVVYVTQTERSGPASAVQVALETYSAIQKFLVAFGDMVAQPAQHMSELIRCHEAGGKALALSSWKFDSEHKLARLMENYAFVETQSESGHNNGTPRVHIYEGMPCPGSYVLSSLYVTTRRFFSESFPRIPCYNKGDGYPSEKHLPYLVGLAVLNGGVVNLRVEDPNMLLGVNTAKELRFHQQHFACLNGNNGRPGV